MKIRGHDDQENTAKIFYGSRQTQQVMRADAPYRPAPATVASREVADGPAGTQRDVEAMRADLGPLGRINVDWRSRREAERIVGDIIRNKLEEKKQEIINRLALDLDANKKSALKDHLTVVTGLERDISRISNEHENDLIEECLNHGLAFGRVKQEHLSRLAQARAIGEIDEAYYEAEVERVEMWSLTKRENLNAKLELMLRNHAEQLERTLRGFTEVDARRGR